MFEPSPITKLYTDAELTRFFRENPLASAEYDMTFLGFTGCYEAAAHACPKSTRIVDAGCADGFQARFFKDFADYRGINLPRPKTIADSPPNKNVWEMFDNVPGTFIEGDATNVLFDIAACEDTSDILVIVSAVPDDRVRQTAEAHFENTLVWYPGQGVRVRGRWMKEILQAFIELNIKLS